jgi:hypothetical protein
MRGPCPDVSRKIYRRIETWRTERLAGDFTHLSLDGVILKRSTLRDSVERPGLFAIGWAAIESAIRGVAAIEKENHLKDPETGQVSKEDAEAMYEEWKNNQDGFIDPDLLQCFFRGG